VDEKARVAAQYRARFDAARHVTEVLDKLYTDAIVNTTPCSEMLPPLKQKSWQIFP
jgi:hypothetical protein